MRFLSIRQPWAAAVACGYKPVENRPWGSDYRGPVAIHAGQSVTELSPDVIGHIHDLIQTSEPQHGVPIDLVQTMLIRGSIIGIADLIGVVRRDARGAITFVGPFDAQRMPHAVALSHWLTGPYGLVFANARCLVRPIPFSGQLGLVVAQPGLKRLLDQSETKKF